VSDYRIASFPVSRCSHVKLTYTYFVTHAHAHTAQPVSLLGTNCTGAFAVDEVFNYAQSDLIDDDVMLLDCFTQVFLWIGSQSVRFGKTERKEKEEREEREERRETRNNNQRGK